MSSVLDNIIQAGEPSKSALLVARLRAVHQLLDDPIVFNDPFALPVLGPQVEALVRNDPFQFTDPMLRGMRAMMVVRSMLAEDELKRAVQAGVRQYVVLGAGLDTFAYRNPLADNGLHVFEVDHPSTQAWKRANLKEAGIAIPDTMTFVGVDFSKEELAGKLQEAGFRADQPAYFSWLGVTVYLPRDAVFKTLEYIASLPKGSGVTFDYRVMPESPFINPIERVISEFIGKMISDQGEPWLNAFDPQTFPQELRELGFQAATDINPPELSARYLARRKDGLYAGGGFRLMCAGT